jgi:hypothetical protein
MDMKTASAFLNTNSQGGPSPIHATQAQNGVTEAQAHTPSSSVGGAEDHT